MKSSFILLIFIVVSTTILSQTTTQDYIANSKSDIIVRGTVSDKTSYWNEDQRFIYTKYIIQIEESLKGSITQKSLTVHGRGGILENEANLTSHMPLLDKGRKYMIHLSSSKKTNSDSTKTEQQTVSYSLISADYLAKDNSEFPNQQKNGANTLSFSPERIAAGNNEVLTITGSDMGTSPGTVFFKRADVGGEGLYPWTAVGLQQIISWTPTEIQVRVPAEAGTGIIAINKVPTGTFYSDEELEIPYSFVSNADPFSFLVSTRPRLSLPLSLYEWRLNSAAPTELAEILPADSFEVHFKRAVDTWKCGIGVDWSVALEPTTINYSENDGINVAYWDTQWTSCYQEDFVAYADFYFESCQDIDTLYWNIVGADIRFNPHCFFDFSFEPSGVIGVLDFQSVALHELGHALMLDHVIDPNDIMHWRSEQLFDIRTLSQDNIEAGEILKDYSNFPCPINPVNFFNICPGDCNEDFNDDGVVNYPDLQLFISQFGEECLDCPQDLNGNGIVNVGDLLQFISNYRKVRCSP